MKDIAHRDLDSSSTAGFGGGNSKRHPALSGTRVRIYAVSFSRLSGLHTGTSIFENNGFLSFYHRCKIVRATGIDLYV